MTASPATTHAKKKASQTAGSTGAAAFTGSRRRRRPRLMIQRGEVMGVVMGRGCGLSVVSVGMYVCLIE